MRLLLIEDSRPLVRSMTTHLQRLGHQVTSATEGRVGLLEAQRGAFDAIVLDLTLPNLDGLEIIRRLRNDQNGVHILVISARDGVKDRVEALNLGADDFMVKPFSLEELAARLKAMDRHHAVGHPSILTLNAEISLDLARCDAIIEGEPVGLTALELSILETLVRRSGRVVSKRQLLESLESQGKATTEEVISVMIHHIRKKLKQRGIADPISTHVGFGYSIPSTTDRAPETSP